MPQTFLSRKIFMFVFFLLQFSFYSVYGKSAYDVYNQLLKDYILESEAPWIVSMPDNLKRSKITVPSDKALTTIYDDLSKPDAMQKIEIANDNNAISFGGEKEGRDFKFLRLAGPSGRQLINFIESFNLPIRFLEIVYLKTVGKDEHLIPLSRLRTKELGFYFSKQFLQFLKEKAILDHGKVEIIHYRDKLQLQKIELFDEASAKSWIYDWIAITDGHPFYYLTEEFRKFFYWKLGNIDTNLGGLISGLTPEEQTILKKHLLLFLYRNFQYVKSAMEAISGNSEQIWMTKEPGELFKIYDNIMTHSLVKVGKGQKDYVFNGIMRFGELKDFNGYFIHNSIGLIKSIESYRDWHPFPGEASYLIKSMSAEESFSAPIPPVWEFQFNISYSIGEFLKRRNKFQLLTADFDPQGKISQLGEDWGHQWIVSPIPKEWSQKKEEKIKEVLKAIQYRTILRSIQGKNRIERNKHKMVFSQNDFSSPLNEYKLKQRGVIRFFNTHEKDVLKYLQNYYKKSDLLNSPHLNISFKDDLKDYFNLPSNSIAIEFRSGTKTEKTNTFNQLVYLAYLLGDDEANQIKEKAKYDIIPLCLHKFFYSNIYQRNILLIGDDLLSCFNKIGIKKGDRSTVNLLFDLKNNRFLFPYFFTFLWNFNNTPWISTAKDLNRLNYFTNQFESIISNNEFSDDIKKKRILELNANFVYFSNLTDDIDRYIMPKIDTKKLDEISSEIKNDEVNAIYIGLEYSMRYPFRDVSLYTHERYQVDDFHLWKIPGKRIYKGPLLTFNRKSKIHFATNVAKQFIQSYQKPYVLKEDILTNHYSRSHGHELSFKIKINDEDPSHKDKQNFGLEWDGIGRTYQEGCAIPIAGTERGGHLEFVTPKDGNKTDQIKAYFKTIDKLQLGTNSYRLGGGHINFDLKPFIERPYIFARFLALFHLYQDVMTMMFQREIRLKGSEPISINRSMIDQLIQMGENRSLTLDTLQKYLMNNMDYVNTRIGRKTRYLQLNIIDYFQNILNKKSFYADFDILNPYVAWRPQFKTTLFPKGEFRLFNMPATTEEGLLQLKMVRAMMDYALSYKKIPDIDHQLNIDFSLYEHNIHSSNNSYNNKNFITHRKGLYEKLNRFLDLFDDLAPYKEFYQNFLTEGLEKTQLFHRFKWYWSLSNRLTDYRTTKDYLELWKADLMPTPRNDYINSSITSTRHSDSLSLYPYRQRLDSFAMPRIHFNHQEVDAIKQHNDDLKRMNPVSENILQIEACPIDQTLNWWRY